MNNNCANGREIVQSKKTCWFHTSVNGFLFTPLGRKLLLKAHQLYKNKRPATNGNSCPRPGTLNLPNFWKYIIARIEKRIPIYEKKAILNIRPGRKVAGGSYNDLAVLCQLIFGAVGFRYTNAFFNTSRLNRSKIKNMNDVPPVILDASTDVTDIENKTGELENGKFVYELNHVYISIYDRTVTNNSLKTAAVGHAITGYTCRGKRYIYDSNFPKSIQLNWRSRTQLQSYFKKVYNMNNILIVWTGVYIDSAFRNNT